MFENGKTYQLQEEMDYCQSIYFLDEFTAKQIEQLRKLGFIKPEPHQPDLESIMFPTGTQFVKIPETSDDEIDCCKRFQLLNSDIEVAFIDDAQLYDGFGLEFEGE